MSKSMDHIILSELGGIYLRAVLKLWPVAVEPKGFDGRNFDVVGLKTDNPVAVIAMETKVSREDFTAGMRKGHFDKRDEISELWLIYNGNFKINELPDHVGILKQRSEPICPECLKKKLEYCVENCNNKKNVFLQIQRKAKKIHVKKESDRLFFSFKNEWLWKIAVSNTTKWVQEAEAMLGFTDGEDNE